jgi:hypothetical protein
MREQVWLHLGVDLKFFRRNRLLVAVAAVFLGMTALSLVGSIVFQSTTGHFETIRAVAGGLHGFTRILTPALGLFLISTHLRNRSLKMVVTKPASPEVWLAAGLLSALVVAAALHVATWLVSVGLSLAWKVPVQAGFGFLALDSFLGATILLAYLSCLAVFLHPVVAVLVVLVLNEGTFYGLMFMLDAATRGLGGNVFFKVLKEVFTAVYMLLPMSSPLAERSQEVMVSLRVSAGDWTTLLMRAGYALVVLVFFYLMSVIGLRRKNLA